MHEKRKLTPMPLLTETGLTKYPQQFENYFNDQFGLRESLLKVHSWSLFTLFHISSSRRVVAGRDGWLFQNGHPHVKDMRNLWPFSESELQHWAKVLKEKQQWLQQHNMGYIFVITPSKHLIYSEKLPASLQPVHSESRTDQLIQYLQRHTTVPVVDMRKALFEKKQDGRLYYKTDTHWNGYGAYFGYRTIMKEIRRQLPDAYVVHLEQKDFSPRDEPGGDLAQALTLQHSLQEVVLTPHTWKPACFQHAMQKLQLKNRNQEWFTTTCPGRRFSLVLFRDSYALALMPYLTESFASITYIPHSPVGKDRMQELALQYKPDLIVEQRTSRWLRTPEG